MLRRLIMGHFVLCLALMPLVAAEIPRPAADLNINLLDGQQISLKQYKGKVVVLQILLTTCSHCLRTSTTMEKLYEEYKSDGVQMLGMAINQGAEENIDLYINAAKTTFPLGMGSHDRAVDFLQHPIMLVLYVPQLVIIDQSGTIIAQYAGTDPFFTDEETNLRAKIEEVLHKKTAQR